jgi:hypothetical protein
MRRSLKDNIKRDDGGWMELASSRATAGSDISSVEA